MILRDHQLTHHFRDVFGMHAVLRAQRARANRLADRLVVLRLRDVAHIEHALEDVLLTDLRACRVHDRVIGRWGLRQPGEHRGLRERHILEVLAEIDARGGREAVGALPQVDLVHVELENLVLAQRGLDLVGEQHLVDLARVGLLAREEEVAGDLHRDRARALCAFTAREIGDSRAQHALDIDAAVLVVAVILDRDDRLLDVVGDLVERHEASAFFAEFADQDVVGRKDPQRDLRMVGGDRVE